MVSAHSVVEEKRKLVMLEYSVSSLTYFIAKEMNWILFESSVSGPGLRINQFFILLFYLFYKSLAPTILALPFYR